MERHEIVLIGEWCKVESHDSDEIIYAEDNTCSCGIGKHHYHCSICGGVNQIG